MYTPRDMIALVLFLLFAVIALLFWLGMLLLGGPKATLTTLAVIGLISVISTIFQGCREVLAKVESK